MAYTPIDKSDDYFNTVIWTGNDVSPRTITGVNFQPDFTWTKRRDGGDGNTNHNLYNSVIGAGNNTELSSNGGGAEGASLASSYGYLSAFASDGFTLTDGTDGSYEDLYTNQSGGTYVGWCWKAGGTASSNTAGSITSNVSANTTAGFSIVSFTGNATSGATVGHGLGVAPAMFILKDRDDAYDWRIYFQVLGNTGAMILNSTTSFVTDSSYYNNTTPSSTVFTLGNNAGTNGSGRGYIAYCFAEKKGFSKFGKYTGNGSTDGTFVYTGFKPAFLIVKRTDSSGYDWLLYDNKRQVSFNVVDDFLNPNSSGVETTGNANQSLDFLSNGVKFKGPGASSNGSGATYIYMAFAESPFVTSTGIPTTAR